MPINTSLKRFIAGATCPQCKAQDCLYMFANDTTRVTCSRCARTQKQIKINKIDDFSARESTPLTWLEK